MDLPLRSDQILPDDADAFLIGRVWSHEEGGPCPVLISGGRVINLIPVAPTVSALLESTLPDRAELSGLPDLGPLDAFLLPDDDERCLGSLLAPCDLQAIKAAGVTFAASLLERVVEERAGGDPARAEELRAELSATIAGDFASIKPGSAEADALRTRLKAEGLWSQYLEVGFGEYAEIFTKAQPMSAVGCGAEIGILSASDWNNPEPEVALVVTSRGDIVGATLANDVNLRDMEGRSALLLGKAKDNNASCAIGPFIRLFDGDFGLADVARAEISLEVVGKDGFHLEGASDMSMISRRPEDLVSQAIGKHHQYPDGLLVLLGTMFAPVEDRRAPGQGFTHEAGDCVKISTRSLGTLINWTTASETAAPWTFGTGALMTNLAKRGVL
ncbi:fumarylacetoacetate hydrolase family protein [Henriciella mobilis]|uniref:Fumarylacetoacetate hydrolase n=1 Tax=Henriciella mobilis TaxID=2305467 RepID=A0A399RLX7_9PROT|nr:fumarylacetoacetate hydrolase family protein [Henriciella mobilis]RIJ32686.1 fumarylacetoacetate hydrolase [Henriciella mobilis]